MKIIGIGGIRPVLKWNISDGRLLWKIDLPRCQRRPTFIAKIIECFVRPFQGRRCYIFVFFYKPFIPSGYENNRDRWHYTSSQMEHFRLSFVIENRPTPMPKASNVYSENNRMYCWTLSGSQMLHICVFLNLLSLRDMKIIGIDGIRPVLKWNISDCRLLWKIDLRRCLRHPTFIAKIIECFVGPFQDRRCYIFVFFYKPFIPSGYENNRDRWH